MHLRSLIFAAAAMVVAIPAAQAAIITNGGFETGDFTGWTVSGGFTGVSTGFAHSGSFAAFLGTVGSSGTLSQSFADAPGQALTLSYFFQSDGGTPNTFEARWNGATIAGSALTNAPASGYVGYSFNLISTGADTLTFLERNDPGFFFLDDVSVSLPEPITLSLFGAGLIGAVAMRRRKNAKA